MARKLKWRIAIRHGLYRIVTPYGGALGYSFTLDRLDLALGTVQRYEQQSRDALRMLRAI